MARRELLIEHLMRRAGFGASQAQVEQFAEMGYAATVDYLLDYEEVPDTVDEKIGQAGYAGVTVRSGQFLPRTNITDARQRWLFRMIHSERPLQEKMTLYWHHHFATAYTKIAGFIGGEEAARVLAAKPSEDPGAVKGHLELIREHALGNFRDFQLGMARDVAMLYWLDGRTNTKAKPQENYARELMELFTFGVGFYTEADVYAGARVFTGWNLRRVNGPTGASDPASRYEFLYNSAQHDTSAKAFTFPIYSDGSSTIPARSAAEGQQDGIDLINACVRHPETGRRLARRLYAFFVSEVQPAPDAFVARVANAFTSSGYSIRETVRAILHSDEFLDDSARFARYSWPVEFVVRAIRETGWSGYSVNDAITPLTNMGQLLFEPPDVNGWDVGPGWFSSGGTLARMNFASSLSTNQRTLLRDDARASGKTPESTLSWALQRLSVMPYDNSPYTELLAYLRAGVTWTGADAQLLVKVPGLVHLILGSPEYQLV